MPLVIIDYGMGNLASVARSFEVCGADVVVSDNPESLKTATGIILPGVGAFADGIKNLVTKNWAAALQEEVVINKIPLLGICLGMQLLASFGSEGGSRIAGLGFIRGEVLKFEPTELNEKIPHVGWNEVEQKKQHPIFNNIESGKDFYFVHSFYFKPESENNILATTPYCGEFASVIYNENIIGAQFHPEKSQNTGMQFLKNFVELC